MIMIMKDRDCPLPLAWLLLTLRPANDGAFACGAGADIDVHVEIVHALVARVATTFALNRKGYGTVYELEYVYVIYSCVPCTVRAAMKQN